MPKRASWVRLQDLGARQTRHGAQHWRVSGEYIVDITGDRGLRKRTAESECLVLGFDAVEFEYVGVPKNLDDLAAAAKVIDSDRDLGRLRRPARPGQQVSHVAAAASITAADIFFRPQEKVGLHAHLLVGLVTIRIPGNEASFQPMHAAIIKKPMMPMTIMPAITFPFRSLCGRAGSYSQARTSRRSARPQ